MGLHKIVIGVVIATLVSLGGLPVSAATNDFEISRYDMKLELGRDAQQRSTLKTTETITAVFPETNQNHGLERMIPSNYEGHTVGLEITAITDEQGRQLEYSKTTDDSGNTIVRVGSKNTYVHGSKTYRLIYSQHDVTRHYKDTGKDEFYWDLNGTQWKVPIRQFSAEIVLGSGLRAAYQQSGCYMGVAGSTTTCQLVQTGDSFRVEASELRDGQNITVALGFTQGAFAAYVPSLMERLLQLWLFLLVVTGVIGFGLMIVAVIRYSAWKNRKKDMGTIVPEYIPPREASVTTAAEVIDLPRSLFAAQLMDFAVRHYLKIYETKEKSLWSNAEYTLEIVRDISSLRDEERELLDDLFDGNTAVGTRLEMKKLQNSTSLYTRLQDNPGKLKKLVRGDYGLREKRQDMSTWFNRMAATMAIAGIVTLSPPLLIFAGIVWAMGYGLWTLTDKGLGLRRYMEGLKLYIGVAEQERLKMLQSPEGAEKVGRVSEDKPEKLVKLYERVLPYAILFGQEKEWGKRLGEYYESAGQAPDWYRGADAHSVFNAAILSSAISNFNTSSSYTSSSSSSTGGSGGGGFSGGGGGGGGGGGW